MDGSGFSPSAAAADTSSTDDTTGAPISILDQARQQAKLFRDEAARIQRAKIETELALQQKKEEIARLQAESDRLDLELQSKYEQKRRAEEKGKSLFAASRLAARDARENPTDAAKASLAAKAKEEFENYRTAYYHHLPDFDNKVDEIKRKRQANFDASVQASIAQHEAGVAAKGASDEYNARYVSVTEAAEKAQRQVVTLGGKDLRDHIMGGADGKKGYVDQPSTYADMHHALGANPRYADGSGVSHIKFDAKGQIDAIKVFSDKITAFEDDYRQLPYAERAVWTARKGRHNYYAEMARMIRAKNIEHTKAYGALQKDLGSKIRGARAEVKEQIRHERELLRAEHEAHLATIHGWTGGLRRLWHRVKTKRSRIKASRAAGANLGERTRDLKEIYREKMETAKAHEAAVRPHRNALAKQVAAVAWQALKK